jgi:hypothetical protein
MMKLQAGLFHSGTTPVLLALAATASILSGCGDAGGFGMAWEDANCDGVRDPQEPPLAGVCVWTSLYASQPTPSQEDCAKEHLQTDSDGWGRGYFYAGCSCSDVYVFAQAPDGFQPTTDTVVNDCEGDFGFAPEGTCPPHASVTAHELVVYKGIRGAACWFGGPAMVVLLVFGYLKFRRHAFARHETRSGE